MRSYRLQRCLAIGAMLALPVMAYAQEATLSGTVTDTTGGALPGVTVRAVHEASGNSFEAVTDERGGYRMPVRVGAYRLTAELAGFAPVTRILTLLVGQEGVVNLQMGVSGVQESVTVTGEAPLLDTTQSSLGGNIDPRQLQELPVNGRNWLDLVLLAPGARSNEVRESPHSLGGTAARGDFQINVDGQQITSNISSFAPDGQPRLSRDAIAEFEFISNRFDATQSRSSGVQINAVTKSGTNTPSGSFAGYFRDDSFNAADFVAKRVLPYQNQQLSGTLGGPIRRDRLHFFGHYEYERTPQSLFYVTPYPSFNAALQSRDIEKKGGARLDAQFSPALRLSGRALLFRWNAPRSRVVTSPGVVYTPARSRSYSRESNQYSATLTHVLSNQAVNEVKVGYSYYVTQSRAVVKNAGARFFGLGAPIIELRGIIIGPEGQTPEEQAQTVYSVRDDFTYSFTKGGRHTVKLGAEYLFTEVNDFRCSFCDGEIDSTRGPVPANLESLFPNILDAGTWNLAPLSPLVVDARKPFGQTNSLIPRYTTGVWVQDDWNILPRLTLNLGVRYDVEMNAFDNGLEVLPFMPGNRPNDTNNVSPRAGFTFSANDRTVIRGGFGIYFGTIYNPHLLRFPNQAIDYRVLNDDRPDFAANPFQDLTYEAILGRLCTPALEPGCLRRDTRVYPERFQLPYSYQPSIGVQRQLSPTMAIEADYVFVGTRNVLGTFDNVNLTFDPATGVNRPFTNVTNRAFPWWGTVSMTLPYQRFNSHALQTAFTKRFSDGWQAAATYTLSGLWDATLRPIQWTGRGFEFKEVPFATPPDLGGEYSLAISDQRHRAVVNGIWQLRYGFQLSGLYFFGSGERQRTRWGVNLRGAQAYSGERRLRPDGTYVPRNSFVGKPIHRVDLRLQRRFALGGRAGIDGIFEVFNLFNHANFGNYFTDQSSSLYGQPQQVERLAYAPRMLQLGFRFVF